MEGRLSGLLGPVQQVALLGVRLRALDAASEVPILGDHHAVDLAGALGLDLGRPKLPRSVVLVHAVRAKTLDNAVRRFVADHSTATVLDVGCGFDTRFARCAPPPTVDWYDVDFAELITLRERFLPSRAHLVAADVTAPGWLHDIPNDRPTMIVTDGLMALLRGQSFIALARALTEHFEVGELAFNAHSRVAMRNSRRVRGPLVIPAVGEGIDDPHEAESWDARLTLIEELSMARAPEVAQYPPVLRAIARFSALSDRLARAGDRVVRYRF
jgi:O-methyltransferase involved in polyketide biosynthesis